MLELGNPDVHKISEITEEPEKSLTVRELTYYGYNGMYSNRGSYYSPDKISWSMISHDFDEGGLYIPLKYASTPCIVNSEGKLASLGYSNPDDTVEAINFLIDAYNKANDTDHTIRSIIALPTATFNKAKKKDNWVNLFEFGKEILPDYLEDISFHRRKLATSGALNAKAAIQYDEFVNNIKTLDDDSEFKVALMPLIEKSDDHCDTVMQKVHMIETLHHKLFRNETIVMDETPFYEDGVFDKYPMLTLVDSLGYNTEWSKLFDYIKLIDRS